MEREYLIKPKDIYTILFVAVFYNIFSLIFYRTPRENLFIFAMIIWLTLYLPVIIAIIINRYSDMLNNTIKRITQLLFGTYVIIWGFLLFIIKLYSDGG